MKLWKTYRWSFIGGILLAVSLIPSVAYLASLSFMPAIPHVNRFFVFLSLFFSLGLMIKIGVVTVNNSPANNRFQFAVFGASGTFVASLLSYILIISPTSGAYAIFLSLPNGIQPIQDELLLTKKILTITTSIISFSSLSLWSILSLGIVIGAISGFFTKIKDTHDTVKLSQNMVPLSIIGVVYAALFSTAPLLWTILIKTISDASEKTNYGISPLFQASITVQIFIPLLWLLIWQIINLKALSHSAKHSSHKGISWTFSAYLNFLAFLFQVLVFSGSDFYNKMPNFHTCFYITFLLLSFSISVLSIRASFKLSKLPRSSLFFSVRSTKKYLLDITLLGILNSAFMLSIPALNLIMLAVPAVLPLTETGNHILLVELIQSNYLVSIQVSLTLIGLSLLFYITTKLTFENLFRYIVRFRKEVSSAMKFQKRT